MLHLIRRAKIIHKMSTAVNNMWKFPGSKALVVGLEISEDHRGHGLFRGNGLDALQNDIPCPGALTLK